MWAYRRNAWGTVVVLAAAAVFVAIIIGRSLQWCPPFCTPTPVPGTPGANVTPAPTGPVDLYMFSSDTKEDWLNALRDSFNASQPHTSSGRPIVVRVEHGNSGKSKDQIANGVITPTVWSPGDQTWVYALIAEWKLLHPGEAIIPDPCQRTVYAPVGIVMFRPMAEAMGWPDKPIGWEDLLELMADPQGWGRYGHPEWGEFKFGHTDPRESNSGQLLLAALAYSISGTTSNLTLQQIKDARFVEAMRTLELHTYHYGNKSRDNIQRMVQQGPGFLHATNGSEAETLRANHGEYGQALYPLAFIYLSGGTFWAEHPYCILQAPWVGPDEREAAQIFEAYLHERPQQELAVDNYLRPDDPSVPR
jgi:Ca-activated chloride channel family protein